MTAGDYSYFPNTSNKGRGGYDAADSVRLRRFACVLTSVTYTLRFQYV